jgi:hypothetical protein
MHVTSKLSHTLLFILYYFIFPYNSMAAQAANLAALAAFDAVLERIGFMQLQHDAIIETTGCHNIAMLTCSIPNKQNV